MDSAGNERGNAMSTPPEKSDRFAALNAQLEEVSGLTNNPNIREMASALRSLIESDSFPVMKLQGFTCVCGHYTGLTMLLFDSARIEFDCAQCDRTWVLSE